MATASADVVEFISPVELLIDGVATMRSSILWRRLPWAPEFFMALFQSKGGGDWVPAAIRPLAPLDALAAMVHHAPGAPEAWTLSGTDFDQFALAHFSGPGGRSVSIASRDPLNPKAPAIRTSRYPKGEGVGSYFVTLGAMPADLIPERLSREAAAIDARTARAQLLEACAPNPAHDAAAAEPHAESAKRI